MRCPECRTTISGSFDTNQVERYGRSLTDGRHELCDSYERVLRANLAAEADLLSRALALDLVSADDFASG